MMALLSTKTKLVVMLLSSCLVIIGFLCGWTSERDSTSKIGMTESYADNQAIYHNMQYRILVRKLRAEPEQNAEPEQTAEPELSTEPNQNAEPTAKLNSTPEPEPEFQMWPEPEPDWVKAKEIWQAAWPIHVYGFSLLFLLLGLISALELALMHFRSRRKTALKISVLTMLFIFCMTRAVALLVNPYGSNSNINSIVTRLIFSIGHPCVISAMSLLLLVLIDTTKMNIAPPTFQRVQFIIVIVIFHVILVLLTDILVSFYAHTKILVLICQVYYLLLGFSLALGYAKVGYKIVKNSSAAVTRDSQLEKLKYLIICAAITGLLMVVLSIYGAAGVFGIFSDTLVVEAWPWWSFQTLNRVLDVAMVTVLLLMNIKVSGSRRDLRALFHSCFNRLAGNKVQPGLKGHSSSKVQSNTWMTN